jgi:RHH-type proline utilization regulon transcriptional repressor/proline dehydrogenase/delta 1-pyrroline-5-carboxylate dehydrogenase
MHWKGFIEEAAVADSARLESLTQQIGRELLGPARDRRSGRLSARFWSDRLMDWSLKDPAFRVQLFRYVDVFPTLRTSAQIHDYLIDYLSQPGVALPAALDLGLKAGGWAKGALAAMVGNRIRAMASNFIAGEDMDAALPALARLWKEGVACSVDLLGEACVSQPEAEQYRQRYTALIETLAAETARWPAQPRLDRDPLGPLPRASVSIKISALDPRVDPIDFQRTVDRLSDTLQPILLAAQRRQVQITFDMEQFALKDLTLALFQQCCQRVEFPAGLALQAYLRGAEEDARRIIDWAQRTGRQITVRLIKGAYWDYEVAHAEELGWPAPVWLRKSQTDACFERMAEQLVAAIPRRADQGGVKLAVGSHNIRSIARVLAVLAENGLDESAVELQMLYGMADQLKAGVAARGLRLREYVPIGPLIPGMAYFVRRLLENSSNQSWLRAGFFDAVGDEQLLASPHAPPEEPPNAPVSAGEQPFRNEPWRDFSQEDQRQRFSQAIEQARVPAVAVDATCQQAEQAVQRAAAAWPDWRDTPADARAEIILKVAAGLRQRRDELAGIMIREAGKPWREADADVCEAIDFCEFYAHTAVSLFQPQLLGHFFGERNELWHEPRGVAAVISPWNFPLAICTGMTVAALVTGNTAVVKPAEQTPGIARALCETLWQAGVPAAALQLLPGDGTVGAALVRDPGVALIAFTGSRQVGLDILQAASHGAEEQRHLKKVICEMGGKNAIIVDESAELDEAVLGVRHSAFSYSGQKCSACSRVILVGAVYETFLKRLIEATQALVLGDPLDPATDVGPLIDAEAAQKVRAWIGIGRAEGQLELACPAPPAAERWAGQRLVGPHIFSGIRPEHRLAQEEVFGPVLSVMRAECFTDAIAIANGTAYKLTGGVYSRKPSHLELARRRFAVGNLYLNRGITGALVGRQPFGGFGLSGTGTKAGGAEYLLHFVEPRSCCENTIRHGFAPGVEQNTPYD